MRFLLEPTDAPTLGALRLAAERAAAAGLDGLLVTASDALPAPLVTASAVAALADDLLVAAEVPLGDRHPLEVAEEAAVVDQAARGRLIVIASPAPGCDGAFEEALDLVRDAGAARPFATSGPGWTVPARLPEHAGEYERRVRVTPPPFGPQLELWVCRASVEMAVCRGLGHVADEEASEAALADAWRRAARPAPAVARARRVPVADGEALTARLQSGRRAFGQDWAIVRGAAAAGAAAAAFARPRLQLDALPVGLEEHWRARNEQSVDFV